MFTGLVRDIGRIVAIKKEGDWKVTIETLRLDEKALAIGASIACDGICLTVIQRETTKFEVQLSHETVSRTTALHWKENDRLNLEPSLCVGDALGGHFVSGHIDGIAIVKSRDKNGDSVLLGFTLPEGYAKFVAVKGSIALNGVSLTVNDVKGNDFVVNIIPHTQSETTLSDFSAARQVNFEVDLIARYADRLLSERAA